MVSLVSGLIVTPQLTQRNVTIDLHFQPSVGILARKIDKLGLDIRSFREPLRRSVKEVMIPSIRTNFEQGGRPEWEPLTDFTVKKKGGDARPLIRTGSLMRMMGYINIWSIDSEKAMITDLPQNVWYGKVHQAGNATTKSYSVKNVSTGKSTTFTETGEGIPARPFVVLQNEDVDAIDRVFSDWLGERIARAGLGGAF